MKLVEITVDAGREADMRDAQARLADANIEAGRVGDARIIAEDLMAFDPSSEAHVNRLRRTLDLLGVADADAVIARCLEPVETFDDVFAADLLALSAATAVRGDGPDDVQMMTDQDEVVLDPDASPTMLEMPPEEIDLSEVLASLAGKRPPIPEPHAGPAPDLDEVFQAMRGRVSGERQVAEALDQFDRGVKRLEHGQESEGIADLEAAARTPLLRFAAAARLGRCYVTRGDLTAGIDWLERAAEAPAADPEDGRALLYELASALQELGETARALAVLMELAADAVAYRDVPQRIEQLRLAGGSR
jgi:tetratricopeptide (TPR) repeat protein